MIRPLSGSGATTHVLDGPGVRILWILQTGGAHTRRNARLEETVVRQGTRVRLEKPPLALDLTKRNERRERQSWLARLAQSARVVRHRDGSP